jgi:TatA/E family protein of Tat protein translocase
MFELLIIAVVLLLIFGAGKLRRAGSDLGAVVKGLRKTVKTPVAARPAKDPDTKADPAATAAGALPDAEFPEVLAARARGGGKPGA